MEKKEEKGKRILPPIDDLISSSTPDLINEALRRVIPSSPSEEEGEKSDSPSDSVKPKDRKSKPEKKVKKKFTTRVPENPVLIELGSESSALIEPSSNRTELSQSPVLIYPSKNYLIIPHFLLDEVFPTLNAYEQILLLRLYRLSYGFKRNITGQIGKKTLADKCNLSIPTIKRTLKSLEKKGLIKATVDKSHDPNKGNRYKVLTRFSDNPVLTELSSNRTQFSQNPIKINNLDDDLKNKNHHLNKVKELYENITRNRWNKSDDDSYLNIKDFDLKTIEQGVRVVFERAKSHPNSLEYFVEEIKRAANPSLIQRERVKKELGEIVRAEKFKGFTGSKLEELVKRRCEREGVIFDRVLYEEMLEEGKRT